MTNIFPQTLSACAAVVLVFVSLGAIVTVPASNSYAAAPLAMTELA